jgi:hypothetical protein
MERKYFLIGVDLSDKMFEDNLTWYKIYFTYDRINQFVEAN